MGDSFEKNLGHNFISEDQQGDNSPIATYVEIAFLRKFDNEAFSPGVWNGFVIPVSFNMGCKAIVSEELFAFIILGGDVTAGDFFLFFML